MVTTWFVINLLRMRLNHYLSYMMKSLFFVLCVLTIPFICKAQDTNEITNDKVKERIAQLRAQGADTIVCYYTDYSNCAGATTVYNADTCIAYQPKYLIWKTAGQSYIQRFDECNTYAEGPVSSTFISTLSQNYKKVQKATLKPVQYVQIIKKRKFYTDVAVDYSCHTKLEVYTPSGVLVKDIDTFAADTKTYDGKNKNIYYKANQSSILVALMKMANDLTGKTASTKKAP